MQKLDVIDLRSGHSTATLHDHRVRIVKVSFLAAGGSSNDSPSFAKMKLVIKNTFIGVTERPYGSDEPGGYDAEEDPPRTLARSASDSLES